jgi:heptaprenyl diphosphate synthase
MISTKKLTLTALLAAVTIVLSAAESFLLPPLPAGVRLGLANVGVMVALLSVGGRAASVITLLKSLFVFAVRGVTAGVMSLSGGLCALAALLVLFRLQRQSSLVFTGAVAAFCHVVGQLAASAVITGSVYVFAYAPLPLLAAIPCGMVTAIIAIKVTKGIESLKIYNPENFHAAQKLRRDTPFTQ